LPEVICNTSPLQYLHQIGLLHILPALSGRIIVPEAVVEELAQGRAAGLSLPDPPGIEWMIIRRPVGVSALPLITDLGAGETEALMLSLESPDSTAILDDALARRMAKAQGIRVIGTLGVLLKAKRIGQVSAIRPYVEQLDSLGFRLAPHTREAVLKLAGEHN
jgi:predicted nucleic acid-binding protein